LVIGQTQELLIQIDFGWTKYMPLMGNSMNCQ